VVADRGVLAYVFWHAPPAGADAGPYEEALRSFHASLRDDPPDGFARSWALRVSGAAWLPGGAGYEDWYVLRGFADLGSLNQAAVSGRRRAPHDVVAGRSQHGAGGVYALWVGEPRVPEGVVAWCAKPPGTRYDAARDALASAGTTTWQRQLVLGPAPELCVVGGGPVPAGVTVVVTTRSEPVWVSPPPATPPGP
jgi:hypothetical protein